jgi:hypothetical protein
LERHFPHFVGRQLSWSKVPDGQDPPDFIGRGADGSVGLELIEWLDGGQMGAAKGRESQRDNIRRAVCEDWHAQHQPRNFNLVVLMPNWNLRISRSDEAHLRQELFTCAEAIDKAVLGGS